MLYNLVVEFQDKLDSIPLLRWIVGIMWQVEFRAFAAVLISFALALWQGPGVIAWLQRKKIGDTVSVPAPGGDRSYEILAVRFG